MNALKSPSRGWALAVGAAILGLAAVFLAPLLYSGHAADDMFAANIRGFVEYHHLTIWQFMRLYNDRLVAQLGRVFPGAVAIQSLTYYLSPEPGPVKIAQEAIILLNLATFGWFVFRLTRSKSTAALAASIAVVACQFRFFYDPYISFVITLPLMMEFALLAGIALLSYIERGGVFRLLSSYALFFLACVTYEVAYPYFLIYGVIAFWFITSRRKALGISAGYLVPVLILIAIDFVLRSGINLEHASDRGEYALSTDIGANLSTLWWQCINALPGSYRFFDPHYIFENNSDIWHYATSRKVSAVLAVAAAALLAVIAWAVPPRPATGVRRYRTLVFMVIGVLLWVLPATLISLSPRWHEQVIPGNAHIPVYFETYGVALILALIVAAIVAYAGRAGTVPRAIVILLFCAIFGAGILVTYRGNQLVVELNNRTWTIQRNTLRDAYANHVFDRTPDETTIFPSGPFTFVGSDDWFWDTRYMIYLYAQKRVAVIPPDAEPEYIRSACKSPAAHCATSGLNTATLLLRTSANDSYVAVANNASLDPATLAIKAKDALIWERSPAFRGTLPERPSIFSAESADASEFRRLRNGPDWDLFAYTPRCSFDPDFLTHGSIVWYEFGPAFYGYESVGATRFNWSREHSTITVHNGSTGARRAKLAFTIANPTAGTYHVLVTWKGHRRMLTIAGSPIPMVVTLDLKPFETATVGFASNIPLVAKSAANPRDLHFQLQNDAISSGAMPHATAGRC